MIQYPSQVREQSAYPGLVRGGSMEDPKRIRTVKGNPYPGKPGASDRPQRNGYPSEARIVDLVNSRREDSLRYNNALFSKLQRWYDTYRGVWQYKLAQFRNNVSIPFTFAMIQSDVARKVQTSFGSWPIVGFEGYGPDDAGRAKKNEVLISAQMKDARSVLKAVDFFLQADISGTAICRWGWKHQERRARETRHEQVAPGYHVPVTRDRIKTIFDGPDWSVVDRLDFWQPAAKTNIPDMAWVIHRYYLDLDDMIEDSQGDDPYFDLQQVMRLRNNPLDTIGQAEFGRRRVIFRNEYDYEARARERYAKPVEIWEMHGLVPDEFAVNGIRDRVIAIGNGRIVLKNRDSQMSEKPFASFCPMPDPYSFDGVAKTEVAFGPQQTANRLANQKLDALDIMIDPPIVVSSSANLNKDSLFTRAGRVILVDGPADETSIRQMTMNMAGVQQAYTEIGSQFGFMQLGTGETESLLGQTSGSSRETARGFLGRQENALTRLAMESRIAEEGFIEPLANAFREMDRRWLTRPHELKILGSLATTNPNTGLPYEAINATIEDEDLEPDYRAKAVGASQMMGRTVRQQNLVSLLQMFSANPNLLQLVNWANFARQAFDLFDFKNVDELLVSKIPAINQMADQSGQSPQGLAAAAGTPLPQMSPDILGQLMQTANAGQMPPMPQMGH